MRKNGLATVMLLTFGTAIIISLASLGKGEKYEVTKEPHRVISVSPAKPRSVHDDINPAMILHLDNGDSIKVSVSKPIPDTIWYEYRKVIKD
ncbi:hypothetical protein EBT16_13055 [bacterium]|nr:hypothetical protein [bacterium]